MATKLGWKDRERWCDFAVDSVTEGDRVAALSLEVMKAHHRLDGTIRALSPHRDRGLILHAGELLGVGKH
jgi:hypothetical protein